MAHLFLVIDSLVGAGAQRQMTNLAVGLSNRGHTVSLFFYHPKHNFLDKLRNSNVEIIEFHKRGRFDVKPIFRLYHEIKSRQPEVVISYLRTPSIYCEIVKLINPSFKLIVSERISAKGGQLTIGDINAGLLHAIASNVNSNSHDYLHHLTAKLAFLKKKSSVIYNGIEPTYFSAFNSRKNLLTDDKIRKFAVVAARCNQVKGAIVLAEAIEKLTKQGVNNFSVCWIGPVDFESSYVKTVTNFLKEHKLESYWCWHGRSDDVEASLNKHDVLISASFQEGVSNVICEAMAMGMPVIVSDVSDNSRILDKGRFGSLFEAGNADDLCGKLRLYCHLCPEDLQQKSKLAHTRAKELFSMDRMIIEWEQLCNRLIANKGN